MRRRGVGDVVAHALTRGMGWGFSERPEPADVEMGAKPAPNAGSPSVEGGSLREEQNKG